MNCQFCSTPLAQPGANTCARCFDRLDMTTGLPAAPEPTDEDCSVCGNTGCPDCTPEDDNHEPNGSQSDQKHERREISADETARRERAQSPRLGYPGAAQMMSWQRDYK